MLLAGHGIEVHSSDNDLVADCLSGNNDAFRELVERHKRLVYSIVLRMSGNPSDADDLAQEVFVRAFTALPTYRNGNFSAWICRIAANLSINARRNGRHSVCVDPASIAEFHANSADTDWESRNIRSNAIQSAISSLSPAYKAVVVLRYTEGLSYSEIGHILGLPVTTVRTRLHRAKQQLKELLEEWV